MRVLWSAVVLASMTGVITFAQEPIRDRLAHELDAMARDLSVMVADGDTRAFFAQQIKDSPRKNVVAVADVVRTALKNDPGIGAERLLDLAARCQSCETMVEACGAGTTPRLDLKLPVGAHRELIGSSETIYVLAAPNVDESQVKSLTAYSNGKPVDLDVNEPPRVPTLVLLPAESESTDPDYPLLFSADESDEANKARIVDDFIGIARIWIDDDHENWWCGDPEIYVRILRFRFSTFSLINERVNLPGVNDEQVWYDIGDPNGTYKFVSTTNYAPVIQFQVWEADSGTHGGDDFLGTVTVTWTGLPFGGYTTFTNGDARLRIDRD